MKTSSRGITVGYTIFNKKHLLPDIIKGIEKCFGEGDEKMFLFDACEDGSSEEAKKAPFVFQSIVPGEELFETKANNMLLKFFHTSKSPNEAIVLFQDDMVCDDPDIKEKIFKVIDEYGDNLGLLGGRDGFELGGTGYPEQTQDMVSSWFVTKKGSYAKSRQLEEGEFVKRTFVNRGPIVLTRRLLDTVGYFDENYCPQWNDDTEYCARSKFLYGLENVVFQCKIKTELAWGATRSGSKLKSRCRGIIKKNWGQFIEKYGKFIS